MTTNRPLRPFRPIDPTRRPAQRGTVLLFGLIAMTILLISAVALVRSFNGTLFNAGNVAFKRDLLNQAERVWPVVLTAMQSGALSTAAARTADRIDSNYRASALWTISSPAIPEALLDDGTFYTVGRAANDITIVEQAVTIRYMVDRLCSAAGPVSASNCTLADDGTPNDANAKNLVNADSSGAGGGSSELPPPVVYRISIRVTGPRNTQAFYQTTFSR